MAVIKRRLLFWLLKAYIKKWGRLFVLFFVLGLAAFFLILVFFTYFSAKFFPPRQTIIGVVGSYTMSTLPDYILQDLSEGLTKLNKNGIASPNIATSWEVSNNGKTYTMHLRPNIHFSDGTLLTSQNINYHFSDVSIKKPNQYTVVFQLKESYAPFLVTLNQPIFKDNFVGIGNTKIQHITLNSGFIQSIQLTSNKTHSEKTYLFYPSEESVKVAFALGEVSEIDTIADLSLQHTSLSSFPNVSIKQQTDYSRLVSLFYNTQDKTLSDKRLRDALIYALPNTFPHSQRAHSPLSPLSWAYQEDTMHIFDTTHAKLLLEAAGYSDKTKVPHIIIDTLPEYQNTAKQIVDSWKKIGVTANVVIVTSIPSSFQVYLGDFHLPQDPDQYTLWHSDQPNNISNYKSLRIDKLLEQGRETLDQQTRLKIYTDFQKYLMDDAPASFLYFPITYTVKRK